jgi:hypothetical protein
MPVILSGIQQVVSSIVNKETGMKKTQIPIFVFILCSIISITWSTAGIDAYARGTGKHHKTPSTSAKVSKITTPGISNKLSSCTSNLAVVTNSPVANAYAVQDDDSIYVSITSFGFNDNDNGCGQYSTSTIAYPQNGGNPTLHNVGTEGAGTYDDPITFAADVPYGINNNTFPPGSRIYVPFLEKYFILEDQCATCGDVTPQASPASNPQYHIDLWMGPSSASNSTALNNCEASITRSDYIIVRSRSHSLAVDTTPLFQNNQCTAKLH